MFCSVLYSWCRQKCRPSYISWMNSHLQVTSYVLQRIIRFLYASLKESDKNEADLSLEGFFLVNSLPAQGQEQRSCQIKQQLLFYFPPSSSPWFLFSTIITNSKELHREKCWESCFIYSEFRRLNKICYDYLIIIRKALDEEIEKKDSNPGSSNKQTHETLCCY